MLLPHQSTDSTFLCVITGSRCRQSNKNWFVLTVLRCYNPVLTYYRSHREGGYNSFIKFSISRLLIPFLSSSKLVRTTGMITNLVQSHLRQPVEPVEVLNDAVEPLHERAQQVLTIALYFLIFFGHQSYPYFTVRGLPRQTELG